MKIESLRAVFMFEVPCPCMGRELEVSCSTADLRSGSSPRERLEVAYSDCGVNRSRAIQSHFSAAPLISTCMTLSAIISSQTASHAGRSDGYPVPVHSDHGREPGQGQFFAQHTK